MSSTVTYADADEKTQEEAVVLSGNIISTSPNGMFNLLAFYPREGGEQTAITVESYFHNNDIKSHICLRLVMGNRPLSTKLDCFENPVKGAPLIYRLQSAAPSPARSNYEEAFKVPVTVQAFE